MFTLYSNSSKTYYLPVEDISTVTDEICVQRTTSDGRVIHVLRSELPGFLKAVFDELHLYSFDQLKYEIDSNRVHNRLNSFLNLPPDILRKIISYMGPYETILANSCQKFQNMVQSPRLTVWAAAATVGDLKLLLNLKPKPAHIKTICRYALNGLRSTEKARLNVLKHFYSKNKYDFKALPLENAAANGDLEILQWAVKCMSTFFSKVRPSKSVIIAAIKNGHLPILMWAAREGFKFNDSLFHIAVIHGHLDIIEWMHKKGLRTSLENTALLNGHLHVLEWGYRNGYTQLDSGVLIHAATLNRPDIMQWAYERGAPLLLDLCQLAAAYGHLEALEWAHNNKLSLKGVGITGAIKGHLKILQWAVDHGENIGEICCIAVVSGQLAVLEWARSKNFQLEESIWYMAACSGHLHILKWAKESGASMDLEVICECALKNKQEGLINWAIQNGLDPDKGKRALLAIKGT